MDLMTNIGFDSLTNKTTIMDDTLLKRGRSAAIDPIPSDSSEASHMSDPVTLLQRPKASRPASP